MKSIDELLDHAHLELTICKQELANVSHITQLSKAMDIIRNIKKERAEK
jgi:hypothetical protein